MLFSELVKNRYSLRSFAKKAVEKEKLLQIIEAARYAPSACNLQPWHFIIITDAVLKERLFETYPREWFKNAPAVIVACGDNEKAWKRRDGKVHCDIDVAIAVEHMALQAAEIGLGTCWVCAFDAAKCHELLSLPAHLEAIALLPIGYPVQEKPPEKDRKKLPEILSWEGYGTEPS